MDKRLRWFFLAKLRAARKTREKRKTFLSVLRNNPTALARIIAESIETWTQEYADKYYRVIMIPNEQQTVSEIMESLRKSFARKTA